MAALPIDRVVDVNVSRNDAFPTRRGFGVPLFMSSVAKTGIVDADNLTKVYGSIEEVAEDWASADGFYQAALAAFSQNPAPVQVKAGYYNITGIDAAGVQTALDAIVASDNEWYWLIFDAPARDQAWIDGAINWTQARHKQLFLDSNDANTESAADTTSVAARNKGTVDRTSVFYHRDASEFSAIAAAGKFGTFEFDDAGSAYTAKFKNLLGVSPVNIGSAAVQAITGFTPKIGQAVATGHMANTYVDVGGRNFLTEGSTLTANVFIDEIHATDWIIARTEEAALGILLNTPRVPFTDEGMEQLASAPRVVMEAAARAGLVANDLNPVTGEFEPNYTITVPSVFSVTEAQRKNRIAPANTVRFRYASAAHYTTINYNMTF